jgi:hypothetical protein
MIETGEWLVPHFWYLPHLDKPPMTYWLVAGSMKLFGQNEWAAGRAPPPPPPRGSRWYVACAYFAPVTTHAAPCLLRVTAVNDLPSGVCSGPVTTMAALSVPVYSYWRYWLFDVV